MGLCLSIEEFNLSTIQNDFVQYAACLMFELRSTKDGPKIEIFYKKSSTSTEAVPLYVPQCGYSCSLSKFYRLYKDIIPTDDFETLCNEL